LTGGNSYALADPWSSTTLVAPNEFGRATSVAFVSTVCSADGSQANAGFCACRVAGSTPAKVRKSTMRKPAPGFCSVGVHEGCFVTYEAGSVCRRQMTTAPTM